MTFQWTNEMRQQRRDLFASSFGTPRVLASAGERVSSRPLPSRAQAERLIKALVNDPQRADRIYDEIPDSAEGKVIGTDLARELLPEYRRREGKLVFTQITSHAAGSYSTDRLRREIEARGKRQLLLMTAGGVAAGKTSGVSDAVIGATDLIFDGTLRDVAWAVETIQGAIEAGWGVEIHYLQRPVALAARGVIRRANEFGRWFPLRNLAAAHLDAQRAIAGIARWFSGHPAVEVNLWLNAGETWETGLRTLEPAEIRPGAPLWYGWEEPQEPECSTTSGPDRPDARWRHEADAEIAQVFSEEVRGGQIDPVILALCAQGSEELNRIANRCSGE
jgi:hypothetical protein